MFDVSNKETDNVMWHSYYSGSIMNLEQLIFTRNVRHLVLTLFASISGSLLMSCKKSP